MKKVNLDVDGVAADFTNYLLEVVQSELRPEDITEWDVLGLLTPEQKEHALEVLSSPQFWGSIPLIEGAREGVDYLNGMGADISWVTSPWSGVDFDVWKNVRRAWLDRHFQIDKNMHGYFPTSEKEKIPCDSFVDDKPANVTKYAAAHPNTRVFLFDQPYNQDLDWPLRFKWDQVEELL